MEPMDRWNRGRFRPSESQRNVVMGSEVIQIYLRETTNRKTWNDGKQKTAYDYRIPMEN